eukprot:scaffold346_cov387-Prasinococcus_capsulatus_cf.AAC.30
MTPTAGLAQLQRARSASAKVETLYSRVQGRTLTGRRQAIRGTRVPCYSIALPESSVPLPRSIAEIDSTISVLGYGANLAEDHPGYLDPAYKARRQYIADLARQHEAGGAIADVDYSPEETAVWTQTYCKLRPLLEKHACREYLHLLDQCNFVEDQVPQLQDMADIMHQATGWTIRPTAGLLSPRSFLNGLAFKTFHSTQYIRHPSQPGYTPEPDVVHELLGHVPMLTNQHFADMMQCIGIASIGASEAELWHLTKVYWYTVEFGAVKEGGDVKGFGAGVLSSIGELEWFGRHGTPDGPRIEDLDPFGKLPKIDHKGGVQPVYFALDSFADGLELLRSYSDAVTLDHGVGYIDAALHTPRARL